MIFRFIKVHVEVRTHVYCYIILTAANKSLKIRTDQTCIHEIVSHLLDVEDLTAEVAAHSDHGSYTGIHS